MIKRNYEVSIWTLQDDFITVLKPSNLEYKGLIYDGEATFKDDGTETFTCSIPMYIYENNERIINPIWHTTQDGTLAETMRKIKLIINKNSSKERIYEFEINKIVEEHMEDNLFCKVEANSLIFHELGKVGYKVSLSGEDYIQENTDWFNGKILGDEPRANIQYWNNKFLEEYPASGNIQSNKWYYKVEIAQQIPGLPSNIIYEDEYVSSWNNDGSASTVVNRKEKERIVDIEESNFYNITQKIAESFGVFCRYQYLYDSNYHIIGKLVIYYNNFIKEEEGYLDLTYPYNTSMVTRERDSTDLITKMFVRSVENNFEASNTSSITNVPANKSGEDYILNFDYLYSIGTISQEQYNFVKEYENSMHNINRELVELEEKIIELSEKIPTLKGKITVTKNSIELDKESISASSALFNSITESKPTVTVTELAPDSVVLLEDTSSNQQVKTYYFKAPEQGILPETLRIFTTKTTSGVSGEIYGRAILDEFGGVSKVVDIVYNNPSSIIVYLTYQYSPQLYYEKVKKTWERKLGMDEAALEQYMQEHSDAEDLLDEYDTTYANKIEEKKDLVHKFERFMGPALREGYWQPEEYKDYGERFSKSFNLSNSFPAVGEDEDCNFIWDTELFDEEQDIEYEVGITQDKARYLCIDLTRIQADPKWSIIKEDLDSYSLLFWDYSVSGQYENRFVRSFGFHSESFLRFIKHNDIVKPVLIVTGAEELTDSQITFMKQTARIGKMTTELVGNRININIENPIVITAEDWIDPQEDISIVYPRVKINSLALKDVSTETSVKYNDNVLEAYSDYYVLTRLDGSYITIMPETLIAYLPSYYQLNVKYAISNAATYIYLDAVKITKENAYPKVSYEIQLSNYDPEFLYSDYELLGHICNINDEDMKLRNVQGYISEITLKLSNIEEDTAVIKNYRNKFEDLFSTIVAETEEIKKNSYMFSVVGGAFTPTGSLTPQVINRSLIEQRGILDNYYQSNFDNALQNSQVLKNMFDEAGQIISDASTSLNKFHALSTENGSLLSSFSNSARDLTPKIYDQNSRPANFKPGDIWKDGDGNTYIAMSHSDSVTGEGGWNKTHDGSLASLNGASISIDAEAGIIGIKARTQLDLASEDIQITGNHSVNIGSKWINLGATSGINIINTDIPQNYKTDADGKIIENVISKMALDKDGILMHASKIDLRATDADSYAALLLDPSEGIVIGNDKVIKLFSHTDLTVGADVLISPREILFGVTDTTASGGSATTVDMTKDYLILAADGDTLEELKETEAGIAFDNNLSGVKITKDSIGLAVTKEEGDVTKRQVILMDGDDGIMIGSGNTEIIDPDTHTGSYVKINGDGLDLGANGNLYLNTDNVKLQTEGDNIKFVLGTNLNDDETAAPVMMFTPDNGLSLDVSHFSINTGGSSTNIEEYVDSHAKEAARGAVIVSDTDPSLTSTLRDGQLWLDTSHIDSPTDVLKKWANAPIATWEIVIVDPKTIEDYGNRIEDVENEVDNKVALDKYNQNNEVLEKAIGAAKEDAIKAAQNELKAYRESVRHWMDFDEVTGLTLGRVGSAFTARLNDTRLGFYAYGNYGAPLSYFGSNAMYITNARATNTLSIGADNERFEWQMEENGLVMRWKTT